MLYINEETSIQIKKQRSTLSHTVIGLKDNGHSTRSRANPTMLNSLNG